MRMKKRGKGKRGQPVHISSRRHVKEVCTCLDHSRWVTRAFCVSPSRAVDASRFPSSYCRRQLRRFTFICTVLGCQSGPGETNRASNQPPFMSVSIKLGPMFVALGETQLSPSFPERPCHLVSQMRPCAWLCVVRMVLCLAFVVQETSCLGPWVLCA